MAQSEITYLTGLGGVASSTFFVLPQALQRFFRMSERPERLPEL